MMHVTEYIVVSPIFHKGICVKCVIVACQKSSKSLLQKKFLCFLVAKFVSLMIHPSIQIAYKYHYPSSTNANYSRQAASPYSIYLCSLLTLSLRHLYLFFSCQSQFCSTRYIQVLKCV